VCGFGEEEDLFESRKKKEIVFESGKRKKKKEILCLLHFLF